MMKVSCLSNADAARIVAAVKAYRTRPATAWRKFALHGFHAGSVIPILGASKAFSVQYNLASFTWRSHRNK